eukprot:15479560-Alexandrium_andersonii.AAC.1
MGPVLVRAAAYFGVDDGHVVPLSLGGLGIPLGTRSWDVFCRCGHALRVARRPVVPRGPLGRDSGVGRIRSGP